MNNSSNIVKIPVGLEEFSRNYADVHGYLSAVVSLFGTFSNLANIIVLTRKSMITSSNIILTWLAVADLLTMVTYLPSSLHFYILKPSNLPFPSSYSMSWQFYMLFQINFSVVCHTIAIWLTINLAIFRYLYIRFPTSGVILCSLRRAKYTTGAIYILTSAICIPNCLQTFVKRYVDENNEIYYGFGDGINEVKNLNFWIQAILIKLVPCCLLTVLTVLLIIEMKKAANRRAQLKQQGRRAESDRAREHNRTTAMLFAVVVLFLLTELPQGILTLCSAFDSTFFARIYQPLGDLLDITALLNNSINFVLYCTMSTQFRKTFTEIFCIKTRAGWSKVPRQETNRKTATTSL
ncbi:unnamed protein product [Dimorphilus gyrociliatus]|uniref:G-protein coupled receptors family 1 profile domain-containing protein n=1 Tax=Dimorphilus gyrociliatus TaxID=2664684 RepID=A0A7I8VLM8_9ANNE|nr:unnamed protein product [Dimorphilus gyrociliatus]